MALPLYVLLMFKYNNLYLYRLLVVQLYKHIDTDTHSLTEQGAMWLYVDV